MRLMSDKCTLLYTDFNTDMSNIPRLGILKSASRLARLALRPTLAAVGGQRARQGAGLLG